MLGEEFINMTIVQSYGLFFANMYLSVTVKGFNENLNLNYFKLVKCVHIESINTVICL